MTKIRFMVEDGEQIEERLDSSNVGWLIEQGYVGQLIEYGNGCDSAAACICKHAYEWETDKYVVSGESGDYLVIGEGYIYPQSQETFNDRFGISSPAEVAELLNWMQDAARGWTSPEEEISSEEMSSDPSPVARRISVDFLHITEKHSLDPSDRAMIMCQMIKSYTAHQSPFLEDPKWSM